LLASQRIVQGKAGKETGTKHDLDGERSCAAPVGKRPRVEEAEGPVALQADSSPAKASALDLQVARSTRIAHADASSESTSRLPRLQLKDVPVGASAAGALAVQRKAQGEPALNGRAATDIARRGVEGGGGRLPHYEQIQASFGHHDISGVAAHEGPAAGEASRSLDARAFAYGDRVAFGSSPDLHTAAHEAAHVVQQRGGVQLKGGIDQPGDSYEQHADTVADAVVAGKSAAPLLDQIPGGGQREAAVQRAPADPGAGGNAIVAAPKDGIVAAPQGGIDKAGFIDHSDGANIRTGPAESGGTPVRDEPLPPATRVFVSGTHPAAPQWWYVTAYLDKTMVRGYVQDLRVNVKLPEPTAKLHQVVSGDTAEKLAVQEYASSVRDGHDLRYYENVLLYVNKQEGRAGITGTYQDPGVFGGGSNNVQLFAGQRIWLVSPAYAKALEGVVPDGSLTGGAVAKVKRFVGHLEDILRSVTESRHHFGEVAGEYAQAIRDHLPQIAGIVAVFIMAEATSAFLAVTPTGVGQIAAVVIQLALAAFGAAGMVQAGIEAVKHASQWLTIAWTAKGNDEKIAAASKEFLKMLVSIAMAALSYLGVKSNFGNALKIANSMPTGGLPALAVAGGGQMGGAGAGTGVLIGPSTGSLGAGGNAMMQADDQNGGGTKDNGSKSADPAKELEEIKEKLKSRDELSAKEKQALRARKKELQDQLGEVTSEVLPEDVPTPTEFKKRASGLSKKEAATDIPSWTRKWPDARPGVHESGTTFATRMMNKRYGIGNWEKVGQQGIEFSELRKFGDRAFE
jgi:hypothetical protein